MKNVIAIISLVLASLSGFSQAPSAFQYQASAQDTADYRFEIRRNSNTGLLVYDTIVSNYEPANGILSVQIGSKPVFDTITWSTGSFFLIVKRDLGLGFVEMGFTQLLSVPFSLYANKAKQADTAKYTLNSGVQMPTVGGTSVFVPDLYTSAYYFMYTSALPNIISIGLPIMYDAGGNYVATGTLQNTVSQIQFSDSTPPGTIRKVVIPFLTTSGWQKYEHNFITP